MFALLVQDSPLSRIIIMSNIAEPHNIYPCHLETSIKLFTKPCLLTSCLSNLHGRDYGFTVSCLGCHSYQIRDGRSPNQEPKTDGVVFYSVINLGCKLPQMAIMCEFGGTKGRGPASSMYWRETPVLLLVSSWHGDEWMMNSLIFDLHVVKQDLTSGSLK